MSLDIRATANQAPPLVDHNTVTSDVALVEAVTRHASAEVLDDIAYPKKAKPEFSHGARFFTMFRDFVATGFFTSKIGIADLKYMGNVQHMWDGAPAEVLQKLGVSYDMKEPAKSPSSK